MTEKDVILMQLALSSYVAILGLFMDRVLDRHFLPQAVAVAAISFVWNTWREINIVRKEKQNDE